MDRTAGTAGHAGTAVVGVLLLVTLLAGCIGAPSGAGPANASDGGDGGPAGSGGSQAGTGAGAADGTAYAFPGQAASEVRWMNGSFAPHEACLPASCVAGFATGDPAHRHPLDVSDALPAGVPTRIEAELTFERTAFGSFYLSLQTDDGVEVIRSRSSVDTSAQQGSLQALVVKDEGGTVEVVVEYSTADADDAADYELRAAVEADPAVVPEGAPVAFEHPGGGADVRFVSTGVDGDGSGGSQVRVMLWDPDDAFLGHVSLDGSDGWAVPLAGPAGTYVAYPASAAGGVRVSVPADEGDGSASAELRVLGTTTTLAEGRDAPPTGEVQWSFTLDRVPLGVGLWVGGDGAVGYWMVEPAGEVVSPEGTVLSFESNSIRGGTGHSAWWTLGSSAMVVGEYQATFSTTASGGMQVGEVVVDYVR